MKPFVYLFILVVGTIVIKAVSINENVLFDRSDASRIVTHNGKTYYFNALITVNWFEAYQLCRQIGFQLLSIQSQAENEWLSKFVIYRGWITLGNTTRYFFWTSGTDLGDGKFIWLSNGQPVTYANWSPDEPNNVGGVEHCIEVRSYNRHMFAWNDAFCGETRNYCICEKRVNCYY